MSSLFQCIYKKSQEFPWQTINGETIIIDPQEQTSFELNEVGSVVWNLTDGLTPVSKIWAAIVEDYEISGDQLETDLAELYQSLEANKLIQQTSGSL